MKKIPLRCHNKFGVYWIEIQSGIFIFDEVKSEDQIDIMKCKGWGSKIKSIGRKKYNFSVYANSGSIYLQIDTQRWDLCDEKVQVSVDRRRFSLINVFRVTIDKQVEFECKTWSCFIKPSCLIDPTFDTMDEESEDFLIYLNNNFNDKNWVNSLKEWENDGL